jgi:hypothetical protein
MRAEAEKRRRSQNLRMIIGGVVVVLAIVALVVMNYIRNQPVAGEETFPAQGNLHIPLGSNSPIEYNSTPPTSGPHYETIVGWGIKSAPERYEHLIHNLEDRGVVIYYQCLQGCPEVVEQLEAIVQPYLAQGRHIVLVPNDPTWTLTGGVPLHKDMGARIAVTAWRKLMTMDEVDEERIRAFIERYEGIDHHNG